MANQRWIGSKLLRVSLAIVFVWFGALKLFDLCPLGGFISRSLPFLPANVFLFTLGCWEVAIGVCFLARPLVRIGLWLLLFHLPGTFLPMIVIPHECFTRFPFALTVEGQYIVKNLVLASAALVIAARHARSLSHRSTRRKPVPTGLPGPRNGVRVVSRSRSVAASAVKKRHTNNVARCRGAVGAVLMAPPARVAPARCH